MQHTYIKNGQDLIAVMTDVQNVRSHRDRLALSIIGRTGSVYVSFRLAIQYITFILLLYAVCFKVYFEKIKKTYHQVT